VDPEPEVAEVGRVVEVRPPQLLDPAARREGDEQRAVAEHGVGERVRTVGGAGGGHGSILRREAGGRDQIRATAPVGAREHHPLPHDLEVVVVELRDAGREVEGRRRQLHGRGGSTGELHQHALVGMHPEVDELVVVDDEPALPTVAQRDGPPAQRDQPARQVQGGVVPAFGPVPRHRLAALAALAGEPDLVAVVHRRDARGGQAPGDPDVPSVAIAGGPGPALVSCEPSSDSECTTLRHGSWPRTSRSARTACSPVRRGSGNGTPSSSTGWSGSCNQLHAASVKPEVVHRAVPPLALEVVGGVVAVLGQQEGLGPCGPNRVEQPPLQVVGEVHGAEPTGHVGGVDPPAVEVVRGAQPPRRDRAGPLVEVGTQLGAAVVELRQRGDAEPGLVLAGVPIPPGVEAGLGAVRVGQRRPEPRVGVAAVVEGEVADHPQAAGVGGRGQLGERLVPAEERVDVVERRGAVPVVLRRREDRVEVEPGDPEVDEVVEVRRDAGEVAAVELPHGGRVRRRDGVVPPGRFGPRGQSSLAPARANRSGNTW
jgi:hypothetical protein